MNIFTRIIEKVFNLEKEQCASCEHLHLLVEQERAEKTRLLATIVEMSRPLEKAIPEPIKAPQPIKSRYVPWQVRKNEMEAMDRKRAQILKEQGLGQISVDDLQKEMDSVEKEIEDASDNARQGISQSEEELKEVSQKIG